MDGSNSAMGSHHSTQLIHTPQKQGLARLIKKQIKELIQKRHPKLSSKRIQSSRSGKARQDGIQTGLRLRLQKPIETSQKILQKLLTG